jgi:EAL domain-containing protein (putative c-di-GMP-specific phosphodiesterase class I)
MPCNRLLVIDDDPAIAAAIETIAKGCGYDAERAVDAAAFLDRVAAWRPTHIVTDLQMPKMDGVELLRELAASQYQGKIMIASGVDGRIVDAARRLGTERRLDIAATLLKPFRAAELREILQRLAIQDEWDTPAALAAAIDGGALFLAYQPKIALATGGVVGFEALVRWQHPRLGTIFPDKFIPLAETAGLIDRLTDAVVDMGIAQVAAWSGGARSLAINLSGRNLHDLVFADRLAAKCAAGGVPMERIVLELTESSAMADPTGAMDILTRLRLKGALLSIDDFGTGFSSLSQLALLPFSELKIDKSFVMASHESKQARAIVKSVIDLAHNLGLRAVAEGVENAEILRLLIELGCDHAQGYHIAKPLPVAGLGAWLAQWESRRPQTMATAGLS